MFIEIMDTTLRDGEQTSGVSFSPMEKLQMARFLLDELKVDRIEIASARVSEGELESARRIMAWAWINKQSDRVEVLGFIDGTQSIDWIKTSGGKVVNLLSKGSLRHLEGQLRKTPQQHFEDISAAVQYANDQGLKVNLYLEDWSNGMRHSKDYVFFLMDKLCNQPIQRFMLPDTLGILNPEETYQFCLEMTTRYPGLHFDFHAHNDYDLSVANSWSALRAGIKGVHTTVNGLGERAGNTPLSSMIAVVKDQLKMETRVNEAKITPMSRMVETFSGIRIPSNKPIIGENVFTQACGVHADGDNKNSLYFNELLPERFGRVRKYALGKTSGKSNILKNLQEMGIDLDPESMKKITQRVIELGDRKENVTADDLPYIMSDVLKHESIRQNIKVVNYSLSVAEGLKSSATLMIEINGKNYQETSAGDGQYDAFMNALHKIYKGLNLEIPRLTDYVVTIPPGGKTDALVETVITWDLEGREFKTRGLDPDQTAAAIKATVRMLNYIS
ncbi:MAG: alpha-isopropylmalate synthase regulatory domain-containing protein [Bacteroidales bacterium]|nr:alpha-isopropylmalate synthase regulatory domain-containing protein [Bacteroidales bacterium]